MLPRSLRTLILAVATTLGGIGSGGAPARGADAVPSLPEWQQSLGRGFDSQLGRIADWCIQGTVGLRGQREGQLSFHYNDRFEDFLRTTSGRLSAGVNLLLIAGSVSVDYFARVAQSELSTSFTAQFESKLGTAVLDQRTLTVAGTDAAALSPAERRSRCGDEFISEAEVGTRLLISSTFHFADSEEFQRFVRTVKVSALFGLIKHKKQFVDETRRFSQTAYMKVDALQLGGAPERMDAIIRQAGRTICRFDDVDACRGLLEALFNYAGAPDGYTSQFGTPYQPQQLALLGYHTARYDESGHDALSVPAVDASGADVPQIVRDMTQELAQQIAFRDRIAVILSTPVSGPRRDEVRSLQDQCEQNLDSLERSLWVCRTRDDPSACRAARQDQMRARHPISWADLHL